MNYIFHLRQRISMWQPCICPAVRRGAQASSVKRDVYLSKRFLLSGGGAATSRGESEEARRARVAQGGASCEAGQEARPQATRSGQGQRQEGQGRGADHSRRHCRLRGCRCWFDVVNARRHSTFTSVFRASSSRCRDDDQRRLSVPVAPMSPFASLPSPCAASIFWRERNS